MAGKGRCNGHGLYSGFREMFDRNGKLEGTFFVTAAGKAGRLVLKGDRFVGARFGQDRGANALQDVLLLHEGEFTWGDGRHARSRLDRCSRERSDFPRPLGCERAFASSGRSQPSRSTCDEDSTGRGILRPGRPRPWPSFAYRVGRDGWRSPQGVSRSWAGDNDAPEAVAPLLAGRHHSGRSGDAGRAGAPRKSRRRLECDRRLEGLAASPRRS